MKAILLTSVLTLTLTATANAAPKVCFGLGDAKGQTFAIDASPEKIKVYNGAERATHLFRSHVSGRDGVTYLEYKVKTTNPDTAILINEALVEPGTEGLLKVRWRDDGFDESIYFCRDK